ncbi:hypothetical protein F2Q70_00009540 [Brassica cretica]|uniref:Uncharacterized protein n=1 Tax=Brassica cretica TaxID=69181 RepID=A0A8S9M617_BRACR|nr:hypothetical protein F2Q70_00009540 [Brassica cretica]
MDELFTGVQGKGAFLNGKPIKGWNFIYFSHTLQSRDFVGQDENNVLFFIVSTQSELVTALLLAEAGVKRDKATLDDATNRINSLLGTSGSVALAHWISAVWRVEGLISSMKSNLAVHGKKKETLLRYYKVWFLQKKKETLLISIHRDVAAGVVIVREAGGLIFDPSGKDLDITSQRIAASNASLKELFVEALRLTNV